jgi:predicted nucleotidyltransferase
VRSDSPLDDIIASRGHLRVLRAADAVPAGLEVSARDLARRAGLAHSRVLRIVRDLAGGRILTVHRVGRSDLYQVNRKHALYAPLHALYSREAALTGELADLLRTRLRSFDWIAEAYIFGSVARGDARAESDVDLAIVAPSMSVEDVDAALGPLADEIRRRFGAELNVVVSDAAAAQRARSRRPGRNLWARIEREGKKLLPLGQQRA